MNELLSQKNLYWAFPIPHSLEIELREIALLLHRQQVSERDLGETRPRFVKALNKSIDSGFEFYYQKPTSEEGTLSPLVKRTVDSIMSTVRHAIHLVVQRLFKKMPLHELKLMAYYLDSMILPENDRYAHLAFPLKEDIQAGFLRVYETIEQTESMDEYSGELAKMLSSVVRESTHYYYHKPTDLLTINRIIKKAADLSIDGATSGIERILRHVIKDISHKQVTLLFSNLHYLLIPADPGFAVATATFVPDKQP